MMKKPFLSLTAWLLAGLLVLGGCRGALSPAEESSAQGTEAGSLFSQEAEAGSYEAETESLSSQEQTRQDFDRFTEKLFQESVVSDTLSLHYVLTDPEAYGITEAPVTFGSMSHESYEEVCRSLEEARAELAAFPREELTESQQLTYDILLSYLTTELSGTDFELYQEALGPTTGIQAQLPVLLAEYTFYSVQDVNIYLQLLEYLPDYYASILEFEQRKSQAGLFFSDTTAEAVIASCESFVEDPENNYLLSTFDQRVDALEGLSSEEREDLKARNREAVENFVIPAYRLLAEGLRGLLGTGQNTAGLAHFPDGQAYYAYLAASQTGSSWTPEEMIERVTRQLSSDLLGLMQIVQTDPDWEEHFDDFDFGLTEPEDMLEDLKGKISEDFPELEDASYTIHYVPESLEESMSPAFYLVPPIDRETDNRIYINRSSGTGGLYTTLAHEGYPGHLYQTVYFTRSGACPLRHLLNFPGYDEGWATYVELLSYGYNTQAEETAVRLQRINSALSLELSALADLYVNYRGYTREQLQDFLASFGFVDDATVQSLFDYVTAEPGAYLPYVIGWLEIEDLRETAEETLGDAFRLKEFHRFLLDVGPAPFDVIESCMEDWMAEQQADGQQAA